MIQPQDRLIKLLEDEVIPDIEEYIDTLFSKIASKNYLDEDEKNLYDMQEMLKEFTTMLTEANNGELEEEECLEIIEEIKQMKDQE